MIPGAFEIQIIVSVVVVLVAALAALICDYLKGNNDWLRLRNTELSVRVEERERFFSPELWVAKIRELLLSPEVRSALVADLKPDVTAEQTSHAPRPPASAVPEAVENIVAPGETWASKEELGRLAERAARIRERHEAAHREEPPAAEVIPAAAEHAAAEHAAAEYAAEERYEQPLAEAPQETFELGSSVWADEPEPHAVPIIAEEFESEALTDGDSNLDELFDRTFGQVQWPTGGAEAPDSTETEGARFPSGLVDRSELEELVSLNAALNGVVAAVTINDFEDLKANASAAELASVDQAVESLISGMLNTERSFASRIADDQYVLLFDGAAGATGQRILFQLSERLWDFQLRSLGRTPVVFSWGGLEVTGQAIADAIEAAQERMRESRRTRKVSPVAIGSQR